MRTRISPYSFWGRWLATVTVGMMLLGLTLVIAPEVAQECFAWLIYGDSRHLATFSGEAAAYVSLVHAVLGSVMLGWGIALLYMIRDLFTRGSREGWWSVAVSLAAWFIPDTAFSLWQGFWPNAVLNVVLIALFAPPLVATYRVFNNPGL